MSSMKKQGVDYEDRISKLEEAVLALQAEVEKLRYQNSGFAQRLEQSERQNALSSQEKDAAIAQIMMRQELLEKKSGSASATIISLEGLLQSKMAELETSNKVLEGRLAAMKEAIPRIEQQVQQSSQAAALKAQGSQHGGVGGMSSAAHDSRLAELEVREEGESQSQVLSDSLAPLLPNVQRRLAASDRGQKDLQDMIKSLQSGQESMALGSQPSRKAIKGNAASDEALILIQQDLQGFKVRASSPQFTI